MGKRQTAKLPPFVAVTWDVLNSEAYRAILPMSAKMLPFFLGKVKATVRDPSYYSTAFPFTYKEATRFGCSRRSFGRVVVDLMRHGFIDPVEKGGLKGCGLTCNTFRLSLRWRRHGKPDFVEIEWASFSEDKVYRQGPNCPPTRAKMTLGRVQG